MLTGDEPLIVRRGGKPIRIAKMDLRTDGVFVPGNADLAECSSCSIPIAMIIATIACTILLVILVNQNDWWVQTQCDYSNCTATINAYNINDNYVTVDILLTRHETKMRSKIRTLAAKAPYICQITTGACYVTCDGNYRIHDHPKLSLEKIHAIPAMIIAIIMILALPLSFVLGYLCLVGTCYGCAMNKAIGDAERFDIATQAPISASKSE